MANNTLNCNCGTSATPNEIDACFGAVEITEAITQEKTITPTTEQQVVTADVAYTALSAVTVEAVDATIDSNIQAENIRKGIRILGVTGVADISATGNGNNVEVDSIDLLPSIGEVGTLYTIVDENAIYRWDAEQLKYTAVARDYQEIAVITGGGASN